ncbi:MAG: hypothetical protein IJ728_00720 [Selenomonadaceae bacterium]|nr:hypothetical protein [Selenomonadaceae bacterium]
MSIRDFAKDIKSAVNKRIENESRAVRGMIKNGKFHSGNKSYPVKQAVECNTKRKVWAVKTQNNKAVIVGG